MNIRMELNPEAMACDCCVMFIATEWDTSAEGKSGPQAYMVLSEKVWEANGRPGSFDMAFENVLSIDLG